MGENEYGKSGHLSIFTLWKALNDAFEVQFFQGFILHLIKDTDSMYRAMAAQFFKVETLIVKQCL